MVHNTCYHSPFFFAALYRRNVQSWIWRYEMRIVLSVCSHFFVYNLLTNRREVELSQREERIGAQECDAFHFLNRERYCLILYFSRKLRYWNDIRRFFALLLVNLAEMMNNDRPVHCSYPSWRRTDSTIQLRLLREERGLKGKELKIRVIIFFISHTLSPLCTRKEMIWFHFSD